MNRVEVLAVVAVSPRARPRCGVAECDHATLATGGHDLVLTERESTGMADGTDLPAPVGGAVRLSAVLDDDESVFVGEFHDRIQDRKSVVEGKGVGSDGWW